MGFKLLEAIYNEYFNLGYINVDINTRFALIALICYIVKALKKKKPDVTYYQVVNKLAEGTGTTEDEVKGLAIMCENFGYGCTDIPTFGIKPADMSKTVKDILNKRMPF